MQIRVLSNEDVAECLSMSRAIVLMEQAFRDLSSGAVVSPIRTAISNAKGTMLYKPALMNSTNRFGIKIVSVFANNAAIELPVTTGVMIVNDATTGLPLALLNAEHLTALRTGAAAGLATRIFANPQTETAAVFGTGGQALNQIQALRSVLQLKTIHVYSRHFDRAVQFCHQHSAQTGECRLVPAKNRLELSECGVISTATTSIEPVFADCDLAPGTHINGVGSFKPDLSEIPEATVVRSHLFVDQRSAALAESGELVQAIRNGRLPQDFSPAEIGEVLAGIRSGRRSPDEITFFKSVGNAAQDIVCANEILEVAVKRNLGQIVELG